MIEQQNTVGFDAIFRYAEKHPLNIGWNEANDIFFNTFLTYKGYNHIYAEDLEYNLEEEDKDSDIYKAARVLADFMKENNLDEMLVLNG